MCICVCMLKEWSHPERLMALDELMELCEPTQVRHVMAVIEPQFQRDFISLLPKEVIFHKYFYWFIFNCVWDTLVTVLMFCEVCFTSCVMDNVFLFTLPVQIAYKRSVMPIRGEIILKNFHWLLFNIQDIVVL